tara:strand:+ start:13986 stop:16583 length:2598 start_codon:yes stop_codon:yes gene_type:complete
MITDYSGSDGFTWWVGEVESNKDPMQLGRVKVRIYGWHTGGNDSEDYLKKMPTEALPWAMCLVPTDKPQVKQIGSKGELQEGAMVVGFFMDGEEGQIPMVMGAFHTVKDQKGDTFAANPEEAKKDDDNPPQAQTLTGEKVNSGNTAVAVVSPPADPGGREDESRGALGKAAVVNSGHGDPTTNPAIVPSEMQGVADGVNGSAGKGFQTDLSRMLKELGNMSNQLARGKDGTYVSIITGKIIPGDPIKERLNKIVNFVSGGLSGMLAPLKQAMAEAISKAVNLIVKLVSKFVPMAVLKVIMAFLSQILDIFCLPVPSWLGLVNSALGDISSFANGLANSITDKITDALDGVANKVDNIIDRMLNGAQKAMSDTAQTIGTVMTGILGVSEAGKGVTALTGNIKTILTTDFSKLDWGSLLGIVMGILKALFAKDCGRTTKVSKTKGWFPLLGTTQCDTFGETLKQSGNPLPAGKWGKEQKDGRGFFNDMFGEIDPYRQTTQTFLNGTSIIEDATPKKEKRIVSGPGGVSTIEDKLGNVHKNVPNNDTRIIAKDSCETVKGNKTLTVEGDYFLKVMGNFNIEVVGAMNINQSCGDPTETTGSSKPSKPKTKNERGQYAFRTDNANFFKPPTPVYGRSDYPAYPKEPGTDKWGRREGGSTLAVPTKSSSSKEQSSVEVKHGDHTIAYSGIVTVQGADVKIQAADKINMSAQVTKIEGNAIDLVADGEITMEANWISKFLGSGELAFVNMFSLDVMPKVSGVFQMVKGSIVDACVDQPGIPPATPPLHIRIANATTLVGGMADVVSGTTGAHFTFVNTSSGGIAEIVNAAGGAIINQVNNGIASYGVNTGFFAAGCSAGPTQIYGLPVLLN